MLKSFSLCFLVSLPLLFSSCSSSSDDEENETGNVSVTSPEKRLLKVEVIEDSFTRAGTRAGEDGTRAPGDIIYTETLSSFTMSYQGEKYSFTKTGTGWTPEAYTWPTSVSNDEKIDFYAYNCPDSWYQYNNGNPYISFSTEEAASYQNDFLVAVHRGISYNDRNGVVTQHFHHVGTAVMFNIHKTNAVADKTIVVKKIVLKNVYNQGDYYINSEEWTNLAYKGNNVDDAIFTLYSIQSGADALTLTTDYQTLPCNWLFLIPQSKTGKTLYFEYTVDGVDKTKEISIGDEEWELGYAYTININVGTSFL